MLIFVIIYLMIVFVLGFCGLSHKIKFYCCKNAAKNCCCYKLTQPLTTLGIKAKVFASFFSSLCPLLPQLKAS